MKVSVHPADEGGCGSYRIIWPAQELIKQGNEITFNKTINGRFLQHPDHTEVLSAQIPNDADVVVLQRPLQADIVRLIPVLKSAGVAIVVEIDDDFTHIHPQNAAYVKCHPKHSPDRNWHWLNEAVKLADLITVSTPNLAKIYGGPKTIVLPNCVPQWYLNHNPSYDDRHGIGWTGSIDTHPDDLQVTHGGLARTPEPVRVVGTGKGIREPLGLDYEPEATGWLELNGEYQSVVSTFKAGLVPLADTAFNRSKSWLKGLEYAAFGVPFVASPTEDYQRLARLGAGSLAKRNRDWERIARELLTNRNLWEEMSGLGRQVAQTFTYEKQSWRWWEAWELARSNAAMRLVS